MGNRATAGSSEAEYITGAIKASGSVVMVEEENFTDIINKAEQPLVIISEGGFFRTTYEYLVSYRGFTFYTESKEGLQLPDDIELIKAKYIWVPK